MRRLRAGSGDAGRLCLRPANWSTFPPGDPPPRAASPRPRRPRSCAPSPLVLLSVHYVEPDRLPPRGPASLPRSLLLRCAPRRAVAAESARAAVPPVRGPDLLTDTGWWQLGVVMLEPPETACEAFYVDARFDFSRVVPRSGLAEFNFPADCQAGVSVAVPFCALSAAALRLHQHWVLGFSLGRF